MTRPALTPQEVKSLQEISKDLAGLQILLSEYKAKVDDILSRQNDPQKAKSKATLLRKAKELEAKARALEAVIKSLENRYGLYDDADKKRAQQKLMLAEAQRLRVEVANLK